MSSETFPRTVRLPGQRLRHLARQLLIAHPLHSTIITPDITLSDTKNRVCIVCISDTHNRQPDLPPGDLLIHSGDLTENGSFDEIQTQLTWLSPQPYQHIVVVPGNHDVLLDEEFLDKYPERRYGQTKTRHDLDWGDIHYLQDSSLTLNFTIDQDPHQNESSNPRSKQLTIYGSPWTPQYTISAFQYPQDEDIWTRKIPSNSDIVITHGPPRLHLDTPGLRHVGCPYLAQEIFRVRPRLHVFGHIHASYGRESLILDGVRLAHDEIMGNWGDWWSLTRMAIGVCVAKIRNIFIGRDAMAASEKPTTLINAAVVRQTWNEDLNSPIVVEL